MLSKNDVVLAYRLLLGREPESAAVIDSARKGCRNLEELRQSILRSREFRDLSMPTVMPLVMEYRFPHDLVADESLIEVDCAPQALSELLNRVERTWSRLGKENPYWSVISSDRFDVRNFAEHQEIFWASGEQEVLRLRQWMKRNRITLPPHSVCLEYGCGTGRITRWLSREFARVVACDISEGHLQLARQAVQPTQGHQVDFVRVDRLSCLDKLPSFDILFSVLVLQHNPPPVIAHILDKLLARLRPGGVAYFQLPTYHPGYCFSVDEYLAQNRNEEYMEMHVVPQRYIFQIAARNDCEFVEVNPDNMTASMQDTSTTFLLTKRHNRVGSL